jgi:glycosyltransferase involved in cell wall biosynthesis
VRYIQAKSLADLVYLDDQDFIGSCYVTLLGREPDVGGLTNYLSELQEKSKLDIVRIFVTSDEGQKRNIALPGLAGALLRDTLEKKVSGPQEQVEFRRDLANVAEYLERTSSTARFDSAVIAPGLSVATTGAPANSLASIVALRSDDRDERSVGPAVWYDLTNIFEASNQSQEDLRQQLDLARVLNMAEPDLRFLVALGDALHEVDGAQIVPLFEETFIVDAFRAAFFAEDGGPAKLRCWRGDTLAARHPCGDGDIVVSWASLGKATDRILAQTRKGGLSVRICSVLSDACMLKSGSPAADNQRCVRYVEWLHSQSAAMLFVNEAVQKWVLGLQAANAWPAPPNEMLDQLMLLPRLEETSSSEVVKALRINEAFAVHIGLVGALDTVYRAWILASQIHEGNIPLLVVCAPWPDVEQEIVDAMRSDPRLAGKLMVLQVSDRELAALLQQAAVGVVPSVGGQARAALREMVRQGAHCIAATVGKADQPADDVVRYVHANDVRGWANAIVEAAETATRANQTSRAPDDEAVAVSTTRATITRALDRCRIPAPSSPPAPSNAVRVTKATIWMDLTLTFLEWGRHITGIIRAELTLAYYLKQIAPDTRYFAYVRGEPGFFFEIEAPLLSWLFDAVDLSASYRYFNDFWKEREASGTAYRNPFQTTGGPVPGHPAYIERFPENSVVFFAAIDQDGTGKIGRCREVLSLVDDRRATMTAQLVYDLTPFLMPQVHHEFTVRGYVPFVEFVSNHFDYLVYGGRTAQRDAECIQRERGWKSPPGDFIEFGSDLALAGSNALPPLERARSLPDERRMLESLGITGAFVITVGSLEPRKNHALLYKAFLELLDRGSLGEDLQMVFIGKPGWNTGGLLATIATDPRVHGRLLILSPSDEELEALYFNCRFTLLPSFYEGWSLTLPESLSYGKFCLASDVDPLREIGRDLVEYIHPLDTMVWADRIEYYINNPEEVERWEAKIRLGWKARTWADSTRMLVGRLHAAHADRYPY